MFPYCPYVTKIPRLQRRDCESMLVRREPGTLSGARVWMLCKAAPCAIVCSPPYIVNEPSAHLRIPSMMLLDEQGQTAILALGWRGTGGRPAAASVVRGPLGASHWRQSHLRRHRQELASARNLWLYREWPRPRLH